jgi:hypothetical protein
VTQAPAAVKMQLGGGEAIECWLNDQQLVRRTAPSKTASDPETVQVQLRAGTNTLLLKIFTASREAWFYYNTDHSVSGAVGPVAEDYPDEARYFMKYLGAERWFANADNTSVERTALACATSSSRLSPRKCPRRLTPI